MTNLTNKEICIYVLSPPMVAVCISLFYLPYDNVDTVLIFGCRGEKSDYFYREEWEKYECQGLLKVITAFSRDQVRILHMYFSIFINIPIHYLFIYNILKSC